MKIRIGTGAGSRAPAPRTAAGSPFQSRGGWSPRARAADTRRTAAGSRAPARPDQPGAEHDEEPNSSEPWARRPSGAWRSTKRCPRSHARGASASDSTTYLPARVRNARIAMPATSGSRRGSGRSGAGRARARSPRRRQATASASSTQMIVLNRCSRSRTSSSFRASRPGIGHLGGSLSAAEAGRPVPDATSTTRDFRSSTPSAPAPPRRRS